MSANQTCTIIMFPYFIWLTNISLGMPCADDSHRTIIFILINTLTGATIREINVDCPANSVRMNKLTFTFEIIIIFYTNL